MSDTFPTPAALGELQALLPVEDRIRLRIRLTPDLARQILALNGRVANPRDERVAYFVRSLKSDSWDVDRPGRPGRVEPIYFSQNLRVGGGWHRLQASDLADRPITVDIARWPGQTLKPGPPLPIAVQPLVTNEAAEAAARPS